MSALPETIHSDQALKSSLENFETCLVTPVMAGELLAWTDELRAPWADLLAQVREHVREYHSQEYQQISQADPELLPRTEKLSAEDFAIEEVAEEFARMLHRFAEHAPKFEPDEVKIAKHLKLLVDDGVEFVTRVRKQEAAVQAWFVEAYTRDRGVAD